MIGTTSRNWKVRCCSPLSCCACFWVAVPRHHPWQSIQMCLWSTNTTQSDSITCKGQYGYWSFKMGSEHQRGVPCSVNRAWRLPSTPPWWMCWWSRSTFHSLPLKTCKLCHQINLPSLPFYDSTLKLQSGIIRIKYTLFVVIQEIISSYNQILRPEGGSVWAAAASVTTVGQPKLSAVTAACLRGRGKPPHTVALKVLRISPKLLSTYLLPKDNMSQPIRGQKGLFRLVGGARQSCCRYTRLG